ncbi:peroxidase family protein [Pelagibius marinus]|uniref:peroxidase family protein n=1 Tax=Pelagibius marinus TaxID=2762760 RepID=UPI0018726F61|nr:peroxidase family protein [Pelagibius marinus]
MADDRGGTSLKDRLLGAALKVVAAVPPLHRLVNKRLINSYAYAAGFRPRAFSMAADYTTWRGLTDRRYSGRHLPAAPAYNAALPPAEEVLKLFKKTGDLRARDTSLLFPFFAQWFTDSFLRTKWKKPDEQDFAENESNHEIDLCQIYGISEVQTGMLRAFEGGRLKSQTINGEVFPAPLFEERNGAVVLRPEFERLYSEENFDRVFANADDAHKKNSFAVGLEHGNSTLGNTLMNTLFLREHNRIAGELQKAHPDWDDERLFQTARNICIVILLKIVIGDYIVHIAPADFPLMVVPGMAEKERWYRTNWIAVEFALLYRWHDLIPSTVIFNGETRDSSALRHGNGWLLQVGVDQACREASRQLAGKIGLGNTPDFLMKVKESSLAMARRCALAPYNAYREHYGKEPIRSFEELTRDPALAAKLKEVYGDIDKLEWFVGIFAEGYDDKEMMGELLKTMVANDAFTQALTNPLLAERVYNAETFSPEGLEIIENTNSLADLIQRNTGVTDKAEVGFQIR